MNRKSMLCVFLLLAFSLLFSAEVLAQSGAACSDQPFSYDENSPEGPSHWCGRCNMEPKWQAPIDIRRATLAALHPIGFGYKPADVKMVNDPQKHQIIIKYSGDATRPDNRITVDGKRYVLKEFHFHEPSEEKINGEQFKMVIHLVNAISQEDAHYCSAQDPYLCNAVVGVLVKEGAENKLIERLWQTIPKPGPGIEVAGVDATQLLPMNQGYYTFPGSLTTPGCDEVVTWYVLKEPITLSREQINRYKEFYSNTARPIQKPNRRTILQTQP